MSGFLKFGILYFGYFRYFEVIGAFGSIEIAAIFDISRSRYPEAIATRRFRNFWIYAFLDFAISRFVDLYDSRFLYSEFRNFEILDFWICGFRRFCFGVRDVMISLYRDRYISIFCDFGIAAMRRFEVVTFLAPCALLALYIETPAPLMPLGFWVLRFRWPDFPRIHMSRPLDPRVLAFLDFDTPTVGYRDIEIS